MTRFYSPWTSRIVLVALVAMMMTSASACDADFDDEPVAYTGPRQRTARGANVRCFESFGKFKRAMAKEGHTSKKGDKAWHHIVGQHLDNKKKFGEYDLHCTDNVVLIDEKAHNRVNSYDSKSREELGGKSLRDWLKPKDFDEQYAHGTMVLQKLGIEWNLVE